MPVTAADARRLMQDIADHPEAHKHQIANIVKRPGLLPLDEGVRARLAAVPWLAEPGIVDVLVEDVFQQPDEDAPEGKRAPAVLFQAFVLVWVAVELLATAAEPPPG